MTNHTEEYAMLVPNLEEAEMPAPRRSKAGAGKTAAKGMMSVYPPFEVAAALGGYRSVPLTIAVRIAAQVIGDSAVAVAERFTPEEWEILRRATAGRQWEPEAPNPGEMLADAVERAHQRTYLGAPVGKGGKESDLAEKRIHGLALKLRECSYLDGWAVIIAVVWRSERDDVKPGDHWWSIRYRAEKIEADKPKEEG